MIRSALFASALALAAAPAVAQMAPAPGMMSPGMGAGMMTAADVGVSPMMDTSATDYVKLAADSDMYEIQSSKLALTKSKDPAVKSFAKEMIADHMMTTKSLMAALRNNDRTIARPGMRLSADNAAKIALLRKAPKGSFDTLYLQQQMAAHQMAWSLHKGYADNGTDASLKQVAATAVPIVEKHIGHAKAMPMAAM